MLRAGGGYLFNRGDYDRELEADLLVNNPDYTLQQTSLAPPPVSNTINAEEESVIANSQLQEARLTAAMKAVAADQSAYSKHMLAVKHSDRSEHQARVFHSRNMRELGSSVTSRWMAKHVQICAVKDVASTVPLVAQACVA